MRRIHRIQVVIALAGLLAAGGAHAFGGMIAIGQGQASGQGMVEVPFTADADLQTPDHKIHTRIHYEPGKVRDDLVMGDQKMTYITRFDLGKSWMLLPQNMYMEFDPDQLQTQGNAQVQKFELVTRETIGRENVGGEETTKYKVVYDTSDGRYGGFTWFTDDNIAVKSLMAKQGGGKNDRIKFEMSNLKRTGSDDSLFELPKGATRFDMSGMGMMGMGGMPGGTMGMPPQTSGTPAPPAPAPSTPADDADEPNVAEQMGDAAVKGAQDQAVEESQKAGREAVKKAFGGLFR
jgi:hypothetical protein